MEDIAEIASTMRYQLTETGSTTENINTGLTELNNITAGCRKSELILIAGKPKMGKTAFMISLLRNMAYERKVDMFENRLSVAYFSVQESKFLVMSYLLSNICSVEVQQLRDGKLMPSQKMDIEEALTKIEKSPLYIVDRSELSVSDIKDSIYELSSEYEKSVDVLFIDGLNLMNYEGELCMHSDKAFTITLLGLKSLAKSLEVPIFVSYQMDYITRSISGRHPSLSDLIEKNKLFTVADMIWFIYRPESDRITEDEDGNSLLGKAEIIVVGQEANGIAKVAYKRQYSKFEDIQQQIQA